MMTLQQLRRFAHRCAFADETLSERDLVRSELGLTPELHAARHGCRAAGTGTLVDQLALELRDAGEHGEHHAPGRRGRVSPGLGERAQSRSRLVQPLGDVEQVARRSRQAIEPGDHDHVVVAQLLQHPLELWPGALGARHLLLERPPAPSRLQRSLLKREILVVGGHASIAEEHVADVHRNAGN